MFLHVDAGREREFQVAFPGPIDLATSLRPFGRHGDDGLDRWDGELLVRTARAGPNGQPVPYAARMTGTIEQPALSVRAPALEAPAGDDLPIAVSRTVVTDFEALAELVRADGRVGALARLYPGLAPVLVTDPFTALIRSISAQQVNLRWASTIRRRLAARYGTRLEVGDTYVYALVAEPLAGATVAELRELQLTNAKAASVIECARAAQAGELEPSMLAAMDDEVLIAHLTRLRGIGRWSAEWFLARTLGRPRVVGGDLGVRKAIGLVYETNGMPTEEEVRRLTAHWGAAATMAQALALQHLAGSSGAA
jgi:DNA-3-methyladenine glycosylase II